MYGANSDLVRSFWDQATGRIGELTDLWLAHEGGDQAAVPALKRVLHTMKGEAHMLGLVSTARLVTSMEDLLHHGVVDSEAVGDHLLTALDVIGMMASSDSHDAPPDLEDLVARVAEIVATAGEKNESSVGAGPLPVSPAPSKPEEPADAPQREVARLDPSVLSPLVHEARRVHREQGLLSPKLREVRRMLHALLAEIDPSLSPEALSERMVKTLGYGADLERRMTDLVSAWSTSEFELETALEQLDDTVRAAAMVSVGALSAQVHRAARVAASALGKRVIVSVRGDAYVDATVERSLGPALLHLVRNAVDHGIEAPVRRERAGKPPEGQIEVVVHQSDSSVRVVVTDDGAGVDLSALRARLASVDRAAALLDDDELLPRIFDHGVSTRSEATEISGRGIGLDVVARQVTTLGGSVRVSSKPGQGTRFELILPTMLRADVVVPVDAASARLAFPARSVLGVERVTNVVSAPDGWRLPRGAPGAAELVPLFDLRALFGGALVPKEGDAVILLQHRTGMFAARVDRYESPRALSFQRIEELPVRSELVRGVAPMPDGGVVLLLDADAVHDALRSRAAPTEGQPAPRARQYHVLVVEDAPVARELLLGLLRSFGLRVSDAADGRQGLRAARKDPPDLILTDIEMPFLGGLEMIAELRSDARFAELPIVVLTTRSEPSVRDRARALGVRFFLSKQRFVESELREVLDVCLTP